jgi:hypothetical protein
MADTPASSEPRAVDKINAVKKAKFVDLYRQTMGHITNTCSAVGINRTTYYNWLDRDPEFAEAIMEAEMELNDDIREVLIQKAADGDMTAVIFYLKNRHPDFKPQTSASLELQQGDRKVTFRVSRGDD